MKLFHWMAAATVASVGVAQAEVPELLELVPEAQGYELIAKFNPREYNSKGYQTIVPEEFPGNSNDSAIWSS